MDPEILAYHFAGLKEVIDKHKIRDPCRIFNLDDCGFSIRGMTLGRSKCAVKKGTIGNTRELTFKGTVDHVTMMPVILAFGKIFTPLLVSPGVDSKYCSRAIGTYKTQLTFYRILVTSP